MCLTDWLLGASIYMIKKGVHMRNQYVKYEFMMMCMMIVDFSCAQN